MKPIRLFSLLTLVSIFGCGGGKYDDLPLDKRYWNADDFEAVVFELKYKTDPDEKLPTFDDPESRIVLEKLTDPQNYLVILDDNELGIKYRNEIAEDFFAEWRNMNKIYWAMDRQDKFIYPLELVECFKFGLGLQLKYFQLGNDAILENAVDPNSSDLRRTIRSNVQTMVDNYGIYLDVVKKEDSFSSTAIDAYAEGIQKYFTELIKSYPDANYKSTLKKLDLLEQRSSSQSISNAISEIRALLQPDSSTEEG